MKINTYTLSIFALLLLVSTACRKEENKHKMDNSHSENEVTIQLSTNASNDTLEYGAELHINGSVVGTQELHGYQLVLKNMMTDSVLFETGEHDHANTYNIHGHWVNDLENTTGLHLTLTVEKDHDGGILTKELHLVGKGQ